MKNIIDIFLNDDENSILHSNLYIINSAKNSKNIFNLESNSDNKVSLYESLYFNEFNDIIVLFKDVLIFTIRDINNNEFYNLIFIFCVYFLKKKNIKLNLIDINDINLSNTNLEKWLQVANLYIRDKILNDCAYKKREKFIYSLKAENINLLNIKNEVLTYDDIIKLSGFENWDNIQIKEYIIKMSDTIENKLKENEKEKFKEIQSNDIDYILSNEIIKEWRKISHKARHKTENALKEWNNISNEDKMILFYTGISICIKILKTKITFH